MYINSATDTTPVSPAGLTQTLVSGQTATQTVTIANGGAYPLAWSVNTGSDGYSVSTCDQPGGPAYDWVEIADTGTKLPHYLSVSTPQGPFNFGFALPFFGTSVNRFWFHEGRGYLSFDSAYTSALGFSYRSRGFYYDTSDPLVFAGYKKLSDTRMVIEIRHARAYIPGNPWIDAQVHLEANGRLTMHYPNLYSWLPETGRF